VHLAGANRGKDAEVFEGNIAPARDLKAACERTGAKPNIIYASSTHIQQDTAYGRSKLEAGDILCSFADKAGVSFTNLVIPHVFGEHGRPFYNSVTSTFCYQLANGEQPEIIKDGDLELIHAQRLCDHILHHIRSASHSDIRLNGRSMKVSELLDRLCAMSETYENHIIPDTTDPLDRELFNTYRSYLYPRKYPCHPTVHQDMRGRLLELIKSGGGGQSFISFTKAGITRGNHFHLRKIERFFVISGHAIIRVRRLFDDTVREFKMDGAKPGYIDIPTMHTHEITNTGESELVTLFWADELFDPTQPDTYAEKVCS
jgi:UDP-2-acetamido-2,6-beta-L-arabino-hexul-4-ose reductase